MSQIILGQDSRVIAWAQRIMPIPAVGLSKGVSIGIADEQGLFAAAIFTDYRVMPHGKDIQLHFAATSPKWATRGNIRAILSYPFLQLECVRLTAFVGRKNKRGRRVLEGIGFRLEGVGRRAYDGRQDAIAYGILREDAERWLSNRPDFEFSNPVADLAAVETAGMTH